MIKNIVKDVNFLKIPSSDLAKNELYIVNDLIDTLRFHLKVCIGMAANMIGYSKNAIVIKLNNDKILPLINPKILEREGLYEAEEGCLSLIGVRKTLRFEKIKISFLDLNFKPCFKEFNGLEAQIIQHEIDHLFGKII